MLHQARAVEDGRRLEVDLCIIGAGAAGITIARALRGRGLEIALLEGGGLDYEDESQAIYQAKSAGLPYFDLDVSRLRYFGGSTNHWGGMCRPFDPIDFASRPWVPHSGWPLTLADLEPWYRRAQEVCRLGAYDAYAADAWFPDVPDLDPARLGAGVWQVEPVRFGTVYRDELARADDVDVFLHANVTRLVTTEEGRALRHVAVQSFAGNRFEVAARAYVLACGGLENPRLMLVSDGLRAGMGAAFDHVGRFFQEHPRVRSGRLVLRKGVLETFHDVHDQPAGYSVIGCLTLGEQAQARHEVLNFGCRLYEDFVGDSGYAALRRLYRSVGRGQVPDDIIGDLSTMLFNPGDTVGGLLTWAGLREADGDALLIWSQPEQAPNPDSRVMLGDERDALGLPRLVLDWRLTELDKRTLQVAHQVMGEELGRLGLGRVQLDPWLEADTTSWTHELDGNKHHIGTTRMSRTPAEGVVDADGLAHGVANLYVAGSSVFPTGGWVNPTLTIVALALRQADHLAARLGAPGSGA